MSPTGSSITVHVPLAMRPRPGRKTIVRPAGSAPSASIATQADPAMVKALARAFRWKRLLDSGRYASISELAAAEKIDRGYVGSVLRLTLLAPVFVEAILNGQQPVGLALSELLQPFPLEWNLQRAKLATTPGAQVKCPANETENIRFCQRGPQLGHRHKASST
jgi:hypothetical protein